MFSKIIHFFFLIFIFHLIFAKTETVMPINKTELKLGLKVLYGSSWSAPESLQQKELWD